MSTHVARRACGIDSFSQARGKLVATVTSWPGGHCLWRETQGDVVPPRVASANSDTFRSGTKIGLLSTIVPKRGTVFTHSLCALTVNTARGGFNIEGAENGFGAGKMIR
jgi:hypothetical protein